MPLPFPKLYPAPGAAEYRQLIQSYAKAAMTRSGFEIASGPVAVDITGCWTLPKSKEKKRKAVSWTCRTSKPDSDNLAKIVLDGLNGVAYLDDAQVCALSVHRWNAAQGVAGKLLVEVWRVRVDEVDNVMMADGIFSPPPLTESEGGA